MGVKEKCAAFLKARYQHSNYQQFFIIFLKEKFARPQLNHSVRISRKIKCRRESREEEEEEKERKKEKEGGREGMREEPLATFGDLKPPKRCISKAMMSQQLCLEGPGLTFGVVFE